LQGIIKQKELIEIIFKNQKHIFLTMRIIILILLIFTSQTQLGNQKQLYADNQIYALSISHKVKDWGNEYLKDKEFLVASDMILFTEVVDDFCTALLDEEEVLFDFYVRTQKIYDLIKTDEIKELLFHFKDNYYLPNQILQEVFENYQTYDVKVIDKKQLKKVFKGRNPEKEWRKFHKKFPNSPGFFKFSKVSYSENFAMVYLEFSYGPLGGIDSVLFFKKDEAKWVFFEEIKLLFS
jgi:hypothetical protein